MSENVTIWFVFILFLTTIELSWWSVQAALFSSPSGAGGPVSPPQTMLVCYSVVLIDNAEHLGLLMALLLICWMVQTDLPA